MCTAKETYFITPSPKNLVVLHSYVDGQILHGTTSQVSGTIRVRPDGTTMDMEIDLRYLTAEKGTWASGFDSWLLEALTYPKATFQLGKLEGWPTKGFRLGDSIEVTAVGTLTLHGQTRPIRLPVSLGYRLPDPKKPGTADLVLSSAFRLRPEEFGIEIRQNLRDLLAEIDVRLYLVGYSIPYRTPSPAYKALLWSSHVIAREYRYPRLEEGHLFLAALTSHDASVKNRLKLLGIPPDSLQTVMERRLKAESPHASVQRPATDPAVRELYYSEAHFEAYRLGETRVTPEHLLLAFLRHSRHWIRSYLAQREVDYDRVYRAVRGTPRPASEVRFLGSPFRSERSNSTELRYARNVWDMQLWKDRIYLGHGNSSNWPPAKNAGPVPVIAYDLQTGRFKTESVVNEEQIDRYRIIDNQLYIPGHDPRDSWELGNFYRLTDTGWEKVRTIPLGIHVYDILGHGGDLFAAEGATKGAIVSRSSDRGRSWISDTLPYIGRAYELFRLGGTLYVSAYENAIFRYEEGEFRRIYVNLFPDHQHVRYPLVVRSTPYQAALLYIGADIINDHQWTPFAVYRAFRIDEAKSIALPSASLPYDILVRDGSAYILTNQFGEPGSPVTVIIYRSDSLDHWEEVVRFEVPSFARSFEYDGNAFYIGLGTETNPLNEASGSIYRVTPPPQPNSR